MGGGEQREGAGRFPLDAPPSVNLVEAFFFAIRGCADCRSSLRAGNGVMWWCGGVFCVINYSNYGAVERVKSVVEITISILIYLP